MARILLTHPGASWSVYDVWLGLKNALERRGHTLIHYRLDHRIAFAGEFLDMLYRRHRRQGGAREKPNDADVLYLAGHGVIERALRNQVDWVLIVSALYLHPDWLVLMQRAGIRTAVLLTESPYDSAREAAILPFVDLAWTNERSIVDALRQINPNVYYLPHAYDPERHYPGIDDPDDVPAHDVVFVGTGFRERIELLQSVDWSGIDLGLYGHWSMLGSRSKMRRYLHGETVENAMTAALYRRAKIGLNLYRTQIGWAADGPSITYAASLNPRAYELAACGVYTISEHRAEVSEIMGDLVPTFTTPQQLERAIRTALEHDDWRRAIAARLPATVTGHTWDDRVKEMERHLAGHAHAVRAIA